MVYAHEICWTNVFSTVLIHVRMIFYEVCGQVLKLNEETLKKHIYDYIYITLILFTLY